uniref:Phospholipase A2 inhibitor subunit gamma B n=1 Tax=Xenopus tropicalis TaxID=8364 RepID=A0A803JRR0_XENTR
MTLFHPNAPKYPYLSAIGGTCLAPILKNKIYLCISFFSLSGYSLSCVHCKVEGENFCQGPERKCPTWGDFVCASTSTITIMGTVLFGGVNTVYPLYTFAVLYAIILLLIYKWGLCHPCTSQSSFFTVPGPISMPDTKSMYGMCPITELCCALSTEGVASKSFSRSCEKRASCGISGSIGYQRGKIKTATTCCFSDACTPSNPALPLENMQRTGLTCRSCTSLNSKWCHTEDTVDCTGEERKCILQTTTTSGSKSGLRAVRGCATNDLCAIGSQSHDFGDIKEWTEVYCTNGSIALQQSILLLLALAALLCIKLM